VELTLLWAALTAGLFAWVGLRVWDDGLPDRPGDRLLAASLGGLLVGRLTAMISVGVNPITHPADIIVVRGGVSTVAATIGFSAILTWANRRPAGMVDAMAPAIVLGVAGWHAGCVWRDACLGTASQLPWAWSQPGSAVTRHPVEIYAALGLVVAAIVVGRLGPRPWLRSGAALASVAGVRLVTEPLRPSLDGGPVAWYAAGLALGIALMVVGDRLPTADPTAPT
jgi:prolipoprotein diacylglyceryltransferase